MPISNRECFRTNLRDALRCQRCGRGPATRAAYHRGFEYHHLRHRAHGGPDVAENLALVCHACHRLGHDGQADLVAETGGPRAVTDRVPCAACGVAFDPAAVEMNCGWYRCAACGARTHLFDHFGYEERASED